MEVYFKADFFKGNRQKLQSLIKNDTPIVITANGLMQRGSDNAYPFHQDANFWYLTGINSPEVILVITSSEEFIILPKRSSYQDIFEGSVNYESLKTISGIQGVLNHGEGWQRLDNLLNTTSRCALIQPSDSYLNVYGMYTNPARQQLLKRVRKSNKALEIIDISADLARMRMVKQVPEINAITAAINITNQAIGSLLPLLKNMSYEYSIESYITSNFIGHNVDNAWKPIIASGHNACVMHYNDNRDLLSPNDLVMIDVGAEVSHYAADITRTLSIGAKPSTRQKNVHQAVIEVQDFAVSLQKPGALMRENELLIRDFMGKKLKELGLIKKITTEEINRFYPHSTSHFLGLEPHDAGDYSIPLQPGVVLTVEPGIYIAEEKIGVRIEDDIIITPSGNKILSHGLGRGLL